MTEYVEIEIGAAYTTSFDLVISFIHLSFIYVLHKTSTRIPKPNQYDLADDTSSTKSDCAKKLYIKDPIKELEESHLDSKYPLFWKVWYKLRRHWRALTTPQYPTYFFTKLTSEQIDDLLEQRMEDEQSSMVDNNSTQFTSLTNSPFNNNNNNKKKKSKKKTKKKGKKSKKNDDRNQEARDRGATTVNAALFSIANQSLTNIHKKRWFEHFGSFLRVWMVICGILSFTLSFAFWVNILLEYTVACITGYKDASYLGFLALFFVIHCVTFFCKRALHCTILLLWNTGDSFRVPFVVVWRFSIFFVCLIWTVVYSIASSIEASDSIFWQLLLRFMVIQGILWQVIYLGLAIISTVYAVWKKYFAQYNYTFLLKLKTYTKAFDYAKEKFIEKQAQIRNRRSNNNDNNNSNNNNIGGSSNVEKINENNNNNNRKSNDSNGKQVGLLRDEINASNSLTSEDTYQRMDSGDGMTYLQNDNNVHDDDDDDDNASFEQVMQGQYKRQSLTEFRNALANPLTLSYKVKKPFANRNLQVGYSNDNNNNNNNSGNKNDEIEFKHSNDIMRQIDENKMDNNIDIDNDIDNDNSNMDMSADSFDELYSYHFRSVKDSTIKLIFVFQSGDSVCFRKFKYVFIPLLIFGMLICFALGGSDDLKFVTFIGYILLIYYFIVSFRRGKWNALYYLYSGRFHESYFNKLQLIAKFDDQLSFGLDNSSNNVYVNLYRNDNDNNDNNNNTLVSPMDKEETNKVVLDNMDDLLDNNQHSTQSQGMISSSLMNDNNHSAAIASQSNKEMLKDRLIDNVDSGLPLTPHNLNRHNRKEIENQIFVLRSDDGASWDMERNKFIATEKLEYLDFWSVIAADSNDYFGFRVFMKASCELFSILLILTFIIAFAVTASYFGNSNSTSSVSSYWSDNYSNLESSYPICSINDFPGKFNVLDMAFLTGSAYYSDKNEILQQLDIYFNSSLLNSNCSVLYPNNYNKRIDCWNGWDLDTMYIHDDKPTYYAIQNVHRNVYIICIRGTYDASDVLQDTSLYSEVSTVQVFSYIVPLTTILPLSFLRDFIWYASIPEGMIDPKSRSNYDYPVSNYISGNLTHVLRKKTSVINQYNNQTLLILGHSLGGGIAEIVGSKLADDGYINVYSFGLSSPGTLYSSEKFGFSIESLDKTSVSVLPRRDPVSAVDSHGGLQETIECEASNFIYCHSSTRSYCDLYYNCGENYVSNVTFARCACGNETHDSDDWDKCAGF